MNKKSLIVSSIIISLTCLSGYFFYQKLHTNNPDDIKDYTGKYILNPDYKEFHKYEWTDLKSVYPTKLAYDSAWFILPPDKYIPKEQPIPRTISSISDPIIRRQAYFNFLCRNEYAAYMTNDIKGKQLERLSGNPEGLLDLTIYRFFPKTSNNSYITNSNPFILPVYNNDFIKIDEKDTYNLYGRKLSDDESNIADLGDVDKFKEVMSYDGSIYEIKYNSLKKQLEKIKKLQESNARYYVIEKYFERDSLRNLGIAGFEQIIYDRKMNKIIFYIKQFNMGAFLPWQTENSLSNFSWAKQSGCDFKPKYINNF